MPRSIAQVGIRLLDSDTFEESVQVDAQPAVLCLPYMRQRGPSDAPEVCEIAIQDGDLFVKDSNPGDAALQAVDTSAFRWIYIESPAVQGSPGPGSSHDTTTIRYEFFESYSLGNIKVPILANFVERNLAAPTTLSGVLKVTRPGHPPAVTNLNFGAANAQKIFDGFNGAGDYDADTAVELTFESRDRFNRVARGKVTFWGRSILYKSNVIAVPLFDPQRLAQLEAAAHELIARGLITAQIVPPPPRGPAPPPPVDPNVWDRYVADPELLGLMRQRVTALAKDGHSWQNVLKVQKEISKQDQTLKQSDRRAMPGNLREARAMGAAEGMKYDAAVVEVLTQTGIEKLGADAAIRAKFAALARPLSRPAVPGDHH